MEDLSRYKGLKIAYYTGRGENRRPVNLIKLTALCTQCQWNIEEEFGIYDEEDLEAVVRAVQLKHGKHPDSVNVFVRPCI